jgi:uncharacterized protein (DUF1501 family)
MEPRNRFHAPGDVTRRQVLGGLAGVLLSGLSIRGAGATPPRERRQLVYLFLSGGVSQLETWDPKPGTAVGGSFGAISTTAPDVRISELLPHLARQMHRVALVRSLNSSAFGAEHRGEGVLTGRVPWSGFRYPTLPEIAAAYLPATPDLPACVELQSTDAFRYESAAAESPLGPTVSPLLMTAGNPAPAPVGQLLAVRDCLHGRKASARDRERYGDTELGGHLLQTRRLVEAGVPVVKVRHAWWDTHADHFEGHRRLTSELDRALSALLQDLHDRGLLESTLVVVASEFGRSPVLNRYGGRDHWPHAWSVALAGAGMPGGVVIGRTSPDGREVVEREVTPAHLHHTCLRALGIDSELQVSMGGSMTALADPDAAPIAEMCG